MTEAQAIIQWKAFDRSRQRYDRRFQAEVMKALNAQFEPIISAVEDGSSNPENLATSYPIEKMFLLLYGVVGSDFARSTYLELMENPPKDGTPDLLTKASAATSADTLSGSWLRFMRRVAETEAAKKIKGIVSTTKDIVRRVLGKAQEQGLSVPDTAKKLREEWAELSKSRAVLIARTEIIASSNAGSLLGARSTGLSLQKSWLATRDKRTRSNHLSVDGQTVDLDKTFSVGGDELAYPGDVNLGAKPSNTIQCRCVMVYKRKQ